MTISDGGNGADRGPRPVWRNRVAVSEVGAPFAFVPGNMLVRGERAAARARTLTGCLPEDREDRRKDREAPLWLRCTDIPDPLAVVRVLRSEGLDAQPEHVFFSHGCGGCEDGPHPAYHYAVAAGDLGAPYEANPYKANPYKANPYKANPYKANPYKANEAPLSTAEPALDRSLPLRPALQGKGSHPRVVILDTGLAGGTDEHGASNADNQRPQLLAARPRRRRQPAGQRPSERISGVLDRPDQGIESLGGQIFPPDNFLDPVAGHGTFIAGLIEQLAGGCDIRVKRVIAPLGDARELDVVAAIEGEAALPEGERPDIVLMSFGGPVLERAFALHTAVASARLAEMVLVASAGNDGVCVPQYPAAFEEVLAVAAVGPSGPPPWTNYGEWVDACAPGVELVSAFFAAFDGDFPMRNTVDIDKFAEWAQWSGTSFSAPVVVAALAREMVVGHSDADEAVRRVVRAPHLFRLPCLGTVVNF